MSPILLWLLVALLQALSAVSVNKTIDMILQELASESDPSDDQFKALLKFDKKLYEAYKSVTSEVPPLPSHWGRLGMMFYERDVNWKQGGGAEAASQVKVAMQLAALNHKQRTMQLRERQAKAESSGGKSGVGGASEQQARQIQEWLDQNKEEGRYGDIKRKDDDSEEEEEEEEDGDVGEQAFVSHLRDEVFAWSLQMAILDIHLGRGDKALKRLDFAAKYADEGSDQDTATLAYHRADAYLKTNVREPAKAYSLYAEALDLDGCASEATEARLKLVQAKIAADADEEKKLRNDVLSGKIKKIDDDDEEDEEEEEEEEEDGDVANVDIGAVLEARLRAFRSEKLEEWLEIASIWEEELEMDSVYNVTVLAATCYTEQKMAVERGSETDEGGLRVVGLPTERQRLTSIMGSSSGQAGEAAQSGGGGGAGAGARTLASMMGMARLMCHPPQCSSGPCTHYGTM